MTPTIDGDDPQAPPRTRRPLSRPVRWAAAVGAVALVAGLTWARTASPPPPPPSLAAALEGTLVYASPGDDGATGRLWFVNVAKGTAIEGPRTVLPDEIVPSGPGGSWIGVRAGGTAYVFHKLSPSARPDLLAEGALVAWVPGGSAVYLVTRDPSRQDCPTLHISFVNAQNHGDADLYDRMTCAFPDGIGVDGLTRPFVSLDGPGERGVYELGYKTLHRVVPDYTLLGVSPLGDMLVGPRVTVPTGPADGASPILRTLLVWKGVGGPLVIGTPRNDLRAERFLAWSKDGHEAAILGTLGGTRAVWLIEVTPGTGRERPRRVGPALAPQIDSVGATFAGDELFMTAAGVLYASSGHGYREVALPKGAPPPSGPILWLDR
ncbi:MAG TPA: hypothetical protein VID47_17800 [Actinomycetota bacterium]